MNALGKHILAEYYGIDADLLNDVDALEALMLAAAKAADATVVQATFHHFSPIGVSGVVVIQESHLSIHTWPEMGYAAVDVFTCGPTVNPRIAYDFLREGLGCKRSEYRDIPRGLLTEFPNNPYAVVEGVGPPPLLIQRDSWFTSRQHTLAYSLKLAQKRLYRFDSPIQRIEVYESQAYGRFLALDGQVVLSERDEGTYHEMMAHIPMHEGTRPQTALVLGGGDGGIVRELLRYAEMELIEVLEWDAAVPKAVQTYFPRLSRSWEDARVKLTIGSAVGKLDATREPVEALWIDFPLSRQHIPFLPVWKEVLAPYGSFIAGLPSPYLDELLFRDVWGALKEVFKGRVLRLGRIAVPTVAGGSYFFAFLASGRPQRISQYLRESIGLRTYNKEMHQAAFALPNELKKLIEQE